ncbi:hypothetical protein ACHAP5_000421 [Fusarium lateritium]
MSYCWLCNRERAEAKSAVEEAETKTKKMMLCLLVAVEVVDLLNLAWAEEAEGGWEEGRGKEEAEKVVEQAS